MIKFGQLLHEQLIWKHDGLMKRTMTLRHHDRVIAQFNQDQGMFKADVAFYVPEQAEALFIFRPKGVFKRSFEVESNDPAFEPAKLQQLKWGGGLSIKFANGDHYIWKSKSVWGRERLLTTIDGIKIAKIELGKWNSKGTITIVSDAPAPAKLSLMVFAGWANTILEIQSASAGAVAAT